PDLPKQKKIASILSDTDRKIDLNNQINDNLSYYFIQLLPVRSSA
ncbi:restriction endonuclease subunit S, partial [Candidatus Chryseobacterium massiliense]